MMSSPLSILVMGLPGTGKTTLASALAEWGELPCYNADVIREAAADWDFSLDGRLRQAGRMRVLSQFELACGRDVVCDFVCPTDETRRVFCSHVTVWMDTHDKSIYHDTDLLFEPPSSCDFRVRSFREVDAVLESLKQLIGERH